VEDLFEGLLTRGPDGSARPGAAEKWHTSADGLTWTFDLRPGLVWSDGKPLTAHDFIWSFRRILDPQTGNNHTYMFWAIKNATAFNKKDITDPEEVGIRADGDRRVIITLERPYALMEQLVSTGYFVPQPRHVIEKHGDNWIKPSHFVSNGPYVLTKIKALEGMTMEKNPRYWNAANIAISEVTYFFTRASQAAWDWYRLGKVDWSSLVPEKVIRLRRNKRPKGLRIDDYNGLFYLLLNTTKPPFDDPRVRMAISLAIDREILTKQVTAHGERPARSLVPEGLTSVRPPPRSLYDADQARALLKQAGYGPNNPFPTTELIFANIDLNMALAEFLQRNLKKNLGIHLELQNLEWKTVLHRTGTGEYSASMFAMGGGIDAIEYLALLESNAAENRSKWSNAEFDTMLQKIRMARTKDKRRLLMRQALDLIDRQQPIVPLFSLTRRALVRPGLNGFASNPSNRHLIKWMSWSNSK
jgi:oligopeptide transport system substrate-binding protein